MAIRGCFFAASLAVFDIPCVIAEAVSIGQCDGGCSGHGVCDTLRACVCDGAWAGRECSFFLGHASEDAVTEPVSLAEAPAVACNGGCSGQGQCVGGLCICHRGFFGPACADQLCPNACFGHGSCSQGACLCSSGWEGPQCQMSVGDPKSREPPLLQVPFSRAERSSIDLRRVPSARPISQETPASLASKSTKNQRFLHPLSGGLAVSEVGRAVKQVWQVADQLVAAAERENRRDATRRLERAKRRARSAWHTVSGDQITPREPQDTDLPSLSLSTGASNATSACLSGCSGHGTCSGGRCVCTAPYVGEFCDSPQCPEDCNGRGMCFSGVCICSPTFAGTSCSFSRCPDDCSGHGYCFGGRCECTGIYGGEKCLIQVHSNSTVRLSMPKASPRIESTEGAPTPDASSIRASVNTLHSMQHGPTNATKVVRCASDCNNRGECVAGNCLCFAGWQGADCSMFYACSGHGSVRYAKRSDGDEDDTVMLQGTAESCECDRGWSGPSCSRELVCASANCSGHGVCSYGVCVCGAGYSGHSCHVAFTSCEYRCGSHGTCDDASRCRCHDGWMGQSCEIARLQCKNNCNGHGTCLGGVCSCDAPFEGKACEGMSYLASGFNDSNPAALLALGKASASATHNPSKTTANSAMKVQANSSSNVLDDDPLTSSWMKPSDLILPASHHQLNLDQLLPASKPQVKSLKVKSAQLHADTMPESTDLGYDIGDSRWHPAVAPLAPSASPQAAAEAAKPSNFLALLGSGRERSQKDGVTESPHEPWIERPVPHVELARPRMQNPRTSSQLQSLLASTESIKSLAGSADTTADSSDIDTLLSDV